MKLAELETQTFENAKKVVKKELLMFWKDVNSIEDAKGMPGMLLEMRNFHYFFHQDRLQEGTKVKPPCSSSLRLFTSKTDIFNNF